MNATEIANHRETRLVLMGKHPSLEGREHTGYLEDLGSDSFEERKKYWEDFGFTDIHLYERVELVEFKPVEPDSST